MNKKTCLLMWNRKVLRLLEKYLIGGQETLNNLRVNTIFFRKVIRCTREAA